MEKRNGDNKAQGKNTTCGNNYANNKTVLIEVKGLHI